MRVAKTPATLMGRRGRHPVLLLCALIAASCGFPDVHFEDSPDDAGPETAVVPPSDGALLPEALDEANRGETSSSSSGAAGSSGSNRADSGSSDGNAPGEAGRDATMAMGSSSGATASSGSGGAMGSSGRGDAAGSGGSGGGASSSSGSSSSGGDGSSASSSSGAGSSSSSASGSSGGSGSGSASSSSGSGSSSGAGDDGGGPCVCPSGQSPYPTGVTCGDVVSLGVLLGLGCSGTTEGFTDSTVPCNSSANYVVCTVPLGVTTLPTVLTACTATNSTRVQMCH